MDKLQEFFQAILQTEENVVPLFVHNPASQKLAAIVIGAESVVMDLVAKWHHSQSVPPKAA